MEKSFCSLDSSHDFFQMIAIGQNATIGACGRFFGEALATIHSRYGLISHVRQILDPKIL
jgi:hypothetical protein